MLFTFETIKTQKDFECYCKKPENPDENDRMLGETGRASRYYVEKLDWYLFPVATESKIPAKIPGKFDKGLNSSTNDFWKIFAAFIQTKNYNIGLNCGLSNLVVIDVDKQEKGGKDLQKLIDVYGELPQTVEARTGSGSRHYFFKNPGFPVKCVTGLKLGNYSLSVDIKADGGYVVLSPSLHQSGDRYEWIHSPVDTKIAELPEKWIDEVLERKENAKTIAVSIPSENNLDEIRGKIRDYLGTCPGAISGESGDKDTFKIISTLDNKFDALSLFSDGEILELLDDWNQKCVPPWNEKELLHKIRSVTPLPESTKKLIRNENSDDDNNHEKLLEKLNIRVLYRTNDGVITCLNVADNRQFEITSVERFGYATAIMEVGKIYADNQHFFRAFKIR